MRELRLEIHTILKQANYDYERIQYNTVVSAAMKMLNALEARRRRRRRRRAADAVLREGLSILLRLLYPVAPHIAHALWHELGFGRRRADRHPRCAVARGRRRRWSRTRSSWWCR